MQSSNLLERISHSSNLKNNGNESTINCNDDLNSIIQFVQNIFIDQQYIGISDLKKLAEAYTDLILDLNSKNIKFSLPKNFSCIIQHVRKSSAPKIIERLAFNKYIVQCQDYIDFELEHIFSTGSGIVKHIEESLNFNLSKDKNPFYGDITEFNRSKSMKYVIQIYEIFSEILLQHDTTLKINIKPSITPQEVISALNAKALFNNSEIGFKEVIQEFLGYDTHNEVVDDWFGKLYSICKQQNSKSIEAHNDIQAFFKAMPSDKINSLTFKLYNPPQPTAQPQQFMQPTAQPQQFMQPTAQPQQFMQPTAQPQQYMQPVVQPQQYMQPVVQPQQYMQPVVQPQQFMQPAAQPQQYIEVLGQSGGTTAQAVHMISTGVFNVTLVAEQARRLQEIQNRWRGRRQHVVQPQFMQPTAQPQNNVYQPVAQPQQQFMQPTAQPQIQQLPKFEETREVEQPIETTEYKVKTEIFNLCVIIYHELNAPISADLNKLYRLIGSALNVEYQYISLDQFNSNTCDISEEDVSKLKVILIDLIEKKVIKKDKIKEFYKIIESVLEQNKKRDEKPKTVNNKQLQLQGIEKLEALHLSSAIVRAHKDKTMTDKNIILLHNIFAKSLEDNDNLYSISELPKKCKISKTDFLKLEPILTNFIEKKVIIKDNAERVVKILAEVIETTYDPIKDKKEMTWKEFCKQQCAENCLKYEKGSDTE